MENKTEKIIGVFWLIISINLMIDGFKNLYTYSTPHILWCFMITIEVVYGEIIYGFLFSVIGYYFIKNKQEKYKLILLILILVFLNFIIDIFTYGFTDIFYPYGFLLIILSIYFIFKKKIFKQSLKELISNPIKTAVFLFVGLSPYLLSNIFPYSSYSFLH